MAQRRKVNNLLALAVLSVVMTRPMHPYEMASAMSDWGKDEDMRIKWGSLYTVVRNLHRHGFLEIADHTREGGRPERTVYAITEAGRDETVDWARELVSTPETEFPRFKAGLSVLCTLHPEEAAALLHQRLEFLDQAITERRDLLDGHRDEVPRLFLVESEYDLAMRAAEAEWTRALVAELTSGTFPGLEQWRAVHEDGGDPVDTANEEGMPSG